MQTDIRKYDLSLNFRNNSTKINVFEIQNHFDVFEYSETNEKKKFSFYSH